MDARPKSAKSVDVPPKYTTEEIAAARKAMNMPGAVIRPAKPAPAKPAPKKSGEDFTLEDILAEYGGK